MHLTTSIAPRRLATQQKDFSVRPLVFPSSVAQKKDADFTMSIEKQISHLIIGFASSENDYADFFADFRILPA